MSVALVIEYVTPGPNQPEYVPVATEGRFSRYWVPAARALGCVWIPIFVEGRVVDLQDLPEVVREFELVRDHFESTPPPEADLAEELRVRSRRVVEVLAGLDPKNLKELFIG